MQEILPSAVLGPSYSSFSPFLNMYNVGKPVTSNRAAKSVSIVASTLAKGIGIGSSFNIFAAFAYSGSSDLQWPHLK